MLGLNSTHMQMVWPFHTIILWRRHSYRCVLKMTTMESCSQTVISIIQHPSRVTGVPLKDRLGEVCIFYIFTFKRTLHSQLNISCPRDIK